MISLAGCNSLINNSGAESTSESTIHLSRVSIANFSQSSVSGTVEITDNGDTLYEKDFVFPAHKGNSYETDIVASPGSNVLVSTESRQDMFTLHDDSIIGITVHINNDDMHITVEYEGEGEG